MTPTERAEKIAFLFRDDFDVPPYLIPKIAAQIEEAERKAKDWCMMQHAKLRRETWFMDGYNKGFHTAREKAAKEMDRREDFHAAKCIRAIEIDQ